MLVFADTQDSCLGYNEHADLCRVTRSLFFFMNKMYPSNYFSFSNEVDAIPDFFFCTSDNKRESLKATHAHDQKTRAKNSAIANVFLENLPKAIHETYEPIHMKSLNTVFLHMFNWFIVKYGKTATKDC